MTTDTFLAFYKSDLQAVYALWVVPLLFLAWLLLSPAARAAARNGEATQRFLYAYCVVFALETILDPFATGPLLRWLGAGESGLGTAIPLAFVLLGDFRVYLLIFALTRLARRASSLGPAFVEAAAWTLIVPIVAYAANSALQHARPGLPEQSLWLVYELAFLGIAIWLRLVGIDSRLSAPDGTRHRVPSPDGPPRSAAGADGPPHEVPAGDIALQRGLKAVAGYAAGYYALWASADVLIMVFALDAGWALRVIPNQLYYAFYLPFVYFQLSSRR